MENTLNFWNISKVYAILVFVRVDKCFIKKAIIKHNQVKNVALSLQLELVGGQIGHRKETFEPINAMVNLRWFKKIGSQIGLLLINLLVFCQKTFWSTLRSLPRKKKCDTYVRVVVFKVKIICINDVILLVPRNHLLYWQLMLWMIIFDSTERHHSLMTMLCENYGVIVVP